MKTQTPSISTGWHYPEVEEYIAKEDALLKSILNAKGKHFAHSQRPAPQGDNYSVYTGEAKAGYERILAKVKQMLQPDSQTLQAKIELDFLKQKVETLKQAINVSNNTIINTEGELEKHNTGGILVRFWFVIILTLLISSGETFFATDSLQVLGGSLLFSMFISISISVALMAASHVIPIFYSIQPTQLRKRLVLLISIVLVIGVFTGLALFRTQYLAKQGIEANPFYFVLMNLFLFGASTILSFLFLPPWEEIKRYFKHLKQHRALARYKKENECLKSELQSVTNLVQQKIQERANLCDYAKYVANTIKALYRESIEGFKSANLASRTDGKTPDCFVKNPPELEIDEFIITFNPHQL